MHELSLTRSLLDIVDEYAERHGFRVVHSLKLSFGRLSCIDAEALKFSFEVLSQGTAAQGALLEMEILPVIVYCFSCEKEFELKSYPSACPQCQGGDILLSAGTQELKLMEMDVD